MQSIGRLKVVSYESLQKDSIGNLVKAKENCELMDRCTGEVVGFVPKEPFKKM